MMLIMFKKYKALSELSASDVVGFFFSFCACVLLNRTVGKTGDNCIDYVKVVVSTVPSHDAETEREGISSRRAVVVKFLSPW